MYYLKTKDDTEYTGLESYVHEMVKFGSVDWFPVGKALVFQKDDTDHNIDHKLDLLYGRLDAIRKKVYIQNLTKMVIGYLARFILSKFGGKKL